MDRRVLAPVRVRDTASVPSGRGLTSAILRAVTPSPIRWRAVLVGGIVACSLAVTPALAEVGGKRASPSLRSSGHCPWTKPAFDATHTPTELAQMVVRKMSLSDKFGMINLAAWHGYQNRTSPIPSLCIPALTLQDGPNGIAWNDTGVTQLPASLALAATFDPTLANEYGALEGNEARRQGVDVIQGPNLNIDRVPQSGRAFEGYGEDPYLVSQMGVADIEGIQSQGVMADAKHFTAYNQETDRISLNENVAWRTLEEMYLPPFEAAVTQANVASIMCSYGSVNLVSDCGNPKLYSLLDKKWGFKGFVRSDLAAVSNAPEAFASGMDAIKPKAEVQLKESIAARDLPMSRIDNAVERILTEMFAYRLVQNPILGKIDKKVTNPAHAATALNIAERSIVLLRNSGSVLPLSTERDRSIAVIGADASGGAMTAGFGSAHVRAPFRSTPLQAIKSAVAGRAAVTYTSGGSATTPPPRIAGSKFVLQRPKNVAGAHATHLSAKALRAMVGTGSFGSSSTLLDHATAMIKVPSTGPYVFSLTSNGNAWLSVAGQPLISSPGLHARSSWSTSTVLRGAKRYAVELSWYPGQHAGRPVVGMRPAAPSISAAVTAARKAKVAVVFASDISMEGTDRASLSLPSDENALIEAVASVNRHTVVVLNTAGAVYMPWLSKVAAVVEAWYPGEEDGNAVAAVLFGKVNPSGHLPVTFPRDAADLAAHTRASFPGVAGTVDYSEGLDVGYRYDNAHGLDPLFAFGFGLSYTTFALSSLSIESSLTGVVANVTVTNTGSISGSTVVQAYLGFPQSAAEPPVQLKAFSSVTLAPGESRTIPLSIAPSAFEAYLPGGWQTVPGAYALYVGTSSADLPLTTLLSPPAVITPPSATAAASSGRLTGMSRVAARRPTS